MKEYKTLEEEIKILKDEYKREFGGEYKSIEEERKEYKYKLVLQLMTELLKPDENDNVLCFDCIGCRKCVLCIRCVGCFKCYECDSCTYAQCLQYCYKVNDNYVMPKLTLEEKLEKSESENRILKLEMAKLKNELEYCKE